MTRIGLYYLISLLVSLAFLSCKQSTSKSGNSSSSSLEVYLVRHAEKQLTGENPALSEAGEKRTTVLANALEDISLDHIHSTSYTRTMKTVELTSKMHGLEIEKYDPRNLNKLVDKIKDQGGKHLVVGHSNTTTDVVKLLGGDPGTAIHEEEYDRMYIVKVSKNGKVNSIMRRYGEIYKGHSLEKVLNHEEVIDGERMLLGQVNRDAFQLEEYVTWFDETYEEYNPNITTQETLESELEEIDIKVFLGTWCSDSQRDVPALYKVLDGLDFDFNQMNLVAIDREKKMPDSLLEGYNIESVPTIILFKDQQELGRIIETPEKTLEDDMLAILKDDKN